jgi:DNA helicase-2/ATP-dependent DNA helicase PcrA
MGRISEEELLKAVEEFSGKELNDKQREAVTEFGAPLKIVAGPGSGKTEVLVLRALYLMAVKGVHPKSLFLVTFTRKASSELLGRLVTYCGLLNEKFPELKLEPYEVYCGTLHSLAVRVMDEFHYRGFQGKKLLDDFERKLFILKSFKEELFSSKYAEFFNLFYPLKGREPEQNDLKYRLELLSRLFDFIPQSTSIALGKNWKTDNPILSQALELYRRYRELLKESGFLDYTHALLLFYDFLGSEEAEPFLKGDEKYYPGLYHVFVDEYQDSNPLDEELYFTLAKKSKGKGLTVVGDPNQALYRFRGAVIDCFFRFEGRAKRELGGKIRTVFLKKNYRSELSIVAFINKFLLSYVKRRETLQGLLEPSSIEHSSEWSSYKHYPSLFPAVSVIEGSLKELARKCAHLVKSLKEEGVLAHLSDAVLLLPSTREFDFEGRVTLAGFVKRELENLGLKVYVPRSKSFKEQEEVFLLVGSLLEILPLPSTLEPEVRLEVEKWKESFRKKASIELKNRVSELKSAFGEEYLTPLELFYRLLPLFNYQKGEQLTLNLAKLSRLLASLSQVVRKEVDGKLGSFRHTLGERREKLEEFLLELKELLAVLELPLLTEGLKEFEVKLRGGEKIEELERSARSLGYYGFTVKEFYESFFRLFYLGEFDLEEQKELPKDAFPIMTIHQSKGLEFPVVFVGGMSEKMKGNKTLARLEELFRELLIYPYREPELLELADQIRKFYVAYSRSMYALILLNPEGSRRGVGFPEESMSSLENFKELLKKKILSREKTKGERSVDSERTGRDSGRAEGAF